MIFFLFAILHLQVYSKRKPKTIEEYEKLKNYTFPRTHFLRDYGRKSLNKLRFLHIPKTGTTFAATVVHYSCHNLKDIYIDVLIRLNSGKPQPWKFDSTCKSNIIRAVSKNGNWWSHIPYRNEIDINATVTIFREPHKRLTSQLIHMQTLQGRMVAFPGLDYSDIVPLMNIFKNPERAFDKKTYILNTNASGSVMNESEETTAVSCTSEERVKHIESQMIIMHDIWKNCSESEKKENKLRGRYAMHACKWAAAAAYPGLQACATKMLLGRNCCEKCPVSEADIQEAIRVLKDEVLFVGLQHRWEDSINTFHTLFGGPLYPEELLTFRANTKNRVKIQAERVVQRYTYDDKDERVYKVAENRLKGMMTEIQRDSEKLI